MKNIIQQNDKRIILDIATKPRCVHIQRNFNEVTKEVTSVDGSARGN